MMLHLFRAGGAYGHYGTEDHEDRTRGEQVHRAHAACAEDIGPGEFDVLHVIRKNPGIMQSGVCRIMGFDKGAVARQTASLEAKGYLRREASPADGRSRCLYATAQAERLKNSKAAVETQFYDWLLAPLTEPERTEFARLLDVLYQRCKAESKAGFPNVAGRSERGDNR